jgi:hypothetical protein
VLFAECVSARYLDRFITALVSYISRAKETCQSLSRCAPTFARVADRLGIGVDGAQFADGLCRAVHQALRRRGDRTNRAAGARELAAALLRAADVYDGVP